MVQVTPTHRRDLLRAGAALTAGGAFVTGCGTTGTATAAPPPTTAGPTSPSASPTLLPFQVTHGPRTAASVALTFHGQGDPALADQLLGTAEQHGAHLTVLAVGSWLDAYPTMARRILDAGHDLGNHTQRHVSINAMAEADARKEITDCAERLRRLTGSIGTWFRPSRAPTASPLVARLAAEAGYPHVLSYDVDSLDYTRPGASAITRKVLAEVTGGSVVSMHFGYPDTVAALPAVLQELHRRGLRAVTTTELLS
ncbi:polysaccharide deacetylase family protein [Streptomyces sp. 900105755]|uniref:polysaccharide deacetylase family protein n=1 Tax=unclassified Streptomyces TaxID=2593676 RepID=UPI000895EB9C|nr:polysaccharide deacetylase family protein [Streptomyces sp. Ag109_O5-10]SEE54076.1 Peptidoglycan/xylan/chitin deacetylase, PgdA/CDA1 family [Streptomyces sp. Ag109_O5-10]